MEAAKCKTSVLCFDEKSGGMHSFVEQDAGIVVSNFDSSLMADSVIELSNNDSQREKLGINASEK